MPVIQPALRHPSKATATVKTLIDTAHLQLKQAGLAFGHGTTNAWDEAVYLILHALRLPLGELNSVLPRKVSIAQRERASHLIEERIRQRIPAAYLTHEAWLGDCRFYVDQRVIVPRSFIAELLRARLAPWIMRPARLKRALDLCTGSGCLAILLAKAFPAAVIDASDVSPPALAVARKNIAAYRLRRRVHALESDMFSELHGERYDLIVANPPYVSAAAMRALPREYRHEPRLALASGADGLDALRVILSQAATYLKETGLLVVEVGHHRRRIEVAFPHHAFIWPQISGGDACVFMLNRRDLVSAGPALKAAAQRPARRARYASHRR